MHNLLPVDVMKMLLSMAPLGFRTPQNLKGVLLVLVSFYFLTKASRTKVQSVNWDTFVVHEGSGLESYTG